MSGFDQTELRNRHAIPMRAVPTEGIERFRETVVGAVTAGWRSVQAMATSPTGYRR